MRAKIVTTLGEFEFEGDQEFVEKQIDRVMEMASRAPQLNKVPEADEPEKPAKKSSKQSKTAKRKVSTVSNRPKMIPNLISGEERTALRTFFDEKKPSTHMDKFCVFAHWLKQNKDIESVSIDDMWTLHKIIGERPSDNLMQIFRDGKSKKGYFDNGAEQGQYALSSIGETRVEYDLPVKDKE